MAWTSPRTWVSNEIVGASTMNTHVRDNLKAIGDAWTSYTPAWTGASSNPTIGNGTIAAAYSQAGKLVNFRIQITMGSTTTYGTGLYSLTLPVTPTSHYWTFQGVLNDSGALYDIIGIRTSTNVIDLRSDPTTAGNQTRVVGATTPTTLGNGDIIFISGTYEAA